VSQIVTEMSEDSFKYRTANDNPIVPAPISVIRVGVSKRDAIILSTVEINLTSLYDI
jgi:hypothetical protein